MIVKEKYKQLFIYHQFGGVRTMDIHGRCKQWNKNVNHKLKEPKNENNTEFIFNRNDVGIY